MIVSVAYFLLGFVICAIIGIFLVDRNLFSISHKLDMFSQQTVTTLSNLNNPAINSLINQATATARAGGIDDGLQVALLALYKMWEDGDIVDFASMADVVVKNVKTFGNNTKEYTKWNKKYQSYREDTGDIDESEED